MIKLSIYFCTFVIGVLFTAMAYATPLTTSDLLSGFNAIIFGNATTSADIEGAAIIGGNFSGATLYQNPRNIALPATFNALNVYGSTYGNQMNMDNSGNAYVGGTVGTTINFNGGGNYIASHPDMSIASMYSELTATSQYLSHLTANSYLPTAGNNEIINAAPDANGLAVFNITAGDLSKIPSYSIAANGATTIIFNVSGLALNFNANYLGNDSLFDNIIWNFFDATNLEFETLLGGSVLAPNASVTNHNQIDGTLVASSWTGQGELHEYAFDGTVPTPAPRQPTATPEPNVFVLFACGMLLVVLWHRWSARRSLAAGSRN
jgi:choice-of-anchor A domain-containing protein